VTQLAEQHSEPAIRSSTPIILVLFLFVIILPILLSFLASAPPADAQRNVALAEVVQTDGAQSHERSGPKETSLPDAWDQTRNGFSGTIDYQFVIKNVPESAPRSAIYVPRVKAYGEVSLDGHLIYSESSTSQSRGPNRIIFVELPPSPTAADQLVIVRVRGYANDVSGISEVYIGPSSELRPIYLRQWFIQEEALKLANWLVIAMSIPFAMLWIRDPKNSQFYGLFAAGAVMFALRNFQRQHDLPFLSHEIAQSLVSVTLGWSALPIWMFFTRYVGRRMPAFERFLIIFTVVGSVLVFFIPAKFYVVVETLGWRLPILLSGIFCIAVMITETVRHPSRSRLFMTCALVAQLVPASHDLIWTFGAFGFSWTRWFPLSFPVLLVVLALVLADDVSTTKRALHNSNADLEIKIAEARQELDILYEKKRQADAETATVEERHRLMRDMHDGVGTHLSLLLTSLKGGELSHKDVTEGVQSSLDELRLLIDARSAATETVVDALANLRHRLQARLTPLGITTKWEVRDGADELKLNGEATLHMLRIVQECINNAVRHGGATEITLEVGRRMNGQDVAGAEVGFVAVKDNGCGPDKALPSTRGNGQGLKSIHARAKSIGGDFALARFGNQTVATVSFAGH
jgi:signal transduction histidine kinase